MWWVAAVAGLVSLVIAGVRARGADRRQRAVMLACWRSGLRFSVLNPFPDTMWLPFPLFGPDRHARVTNVVWDRRDDATRVFDLRVRSLASERPGGIENLTDHLAMSCAVVPLASATPPMTVLARGTTDPSGLPLRGVGVTLELDTFNRRFLVMTDDARAATAFCDQRMMRSLMALPLPVTVHVNERTMLLVSPTLPAGQMLVLLEAARGLGRAVPRVIESLYPPRPIEGPHEERWFQGRWSSDPTSSESAPS